MQCLTLKGFIIAVWHIIEPETELVWELAHEALALHLEAVTRGDITRLLINVPPGSMKSLMVCVFWPAWEWGPMNMAHHKFLSTSFKESHAKRDAIKTRVLLESPLYRDLWGKAFKVVRGGEASFENDRGGFRKARPIGSLTGDRGDRLIIDDPHSTEMAESEAERHRTARLISESLPTRLNHPKLSAIIVIMQRLHEDDASGILLAKELGYVHLCLPMRFEPDRRCVTKIGFVDPRTYEGELLFKERFDLNTLDDLERSMGPYAVAGQHQQRPAPRDGNLFKRSWFEIVDAVPEGGTDARAWDLASTAQLGNNDPDYTVGLKGRRVLGDLYITDMARERLGPGIIEAKIRDVAQKDGYDCRQRFAQDPGSAGKAYAEVLIRMLPNSSVIVEPVTGSKYMRAMPAVVDASIGKIKLLRGPWNDAFLDEVCGFPTSRHDDIVDALSDLFDELNRYGGYNLDYIS